VYKKYDSIGEFQQMTGMDPAASTYTWNNVGQFDKDVRELCTPTPNVSVKPDLRSLGRFYSPAGATPHFSTYASALVLGYLPEMEDRFRVAYEKHDAATVKLWLRTTGKSYFALWSRINSTIRVWDFPSA
jgi:hypothetical protein